MSVRKTGAFLLALSVLGAMDARADERDAWLGRDKAMHFGAGSLLSAGGYGVSALVLEEREHRIVAGLVAGVGAGVGKELYDRSRGGTASWRDLTWGAVGAVTGVTIGWLIDRARNRRPPRPVALPAPDRRPPSRPQANTLTTTRPFFARPSSVSLGATTRFSP